jgi:hypothetical protein
MTQQLARVFEAAIGRHPQEWRILRKVFVAGLDPDRLAQLRRNRDWPLALSAGGYERAPAGLTIAGMPPPHEEDHGGAAS